MIVLTALLLFAFTPVQTNERVRDTWKGPDSSAARELFKEDAAPARTPANTAAVKFTPSGDSGVIKSLSEALGSTPEELAKFQVAESAKWGKIIKSAGLQPE